MLETHYERAPITEAVIDVRVVLNPSTGVAVFEPPVKEEREADRYPTNNRMEKFQAKVQVAPGQSPQVTADSRSPLGYMAVSGDKKQIFQMRLDGFTFSRLQPYERWSSFRDEAKRLWSQYCSVASPQTITRLAVRYINKLELPLPLSDFSAYVHGTPDIPRGVNSAVSSMLVQLKIPYPSMPGEVLLNYATLPVERPDVLPFLLDIDYASYHSMAPNDRIMWQVFEELHDEKNRIFEALITDDTRKLIR